MHLELKMEQRPMPLISRGKKWLLCGNAAGPPNKPRCAAEREGVIISFGEQEQLWAKYL